MRQFISTLIFISFCAAGFSQNVGIGTTNPLYKFQVNNGSIAIYDTTDSKAWYFKYNDSANSFSLAEDGSNRISVANGGNVGIGVSAPLYKLDVAGNTHCNNAYLDGYLGIGTTSPSYKLQINDGSVALFNTADSKTWVYNYSSGGNYLNISEDGTSRMVVANGGNVGIGTTAPVTKLDVAGGGNFTGSVNTNSNLNADGSLAVGGNANVAGNVTVNGNKGLIHNTAGSTQLKYYTRTAAFSTANMAAFATSAEGSIGFGGGFTSPPQVIVGDIVSTGGTVGQLYRVQLVIYDVTATGCHCRLINTSNGAVNYSITWNIICIGN